jgi:hypothetical protein
MMSGDSGENRDLTAQNAIKLRITGTYARPLSEIRMKNSYRKTLHNTLTLASLDFNMEKIKKVLLSLAEYGQI